MNVTLNKTDSVNAVLTIEVEKADYMNNVENSLKDLRRNAVIPGFRKGMAPPSFLSQKYGKSILAEELNKLVSQTLSDYIKDNDLSVLGEPLPEEGQAPIDFDAQEDFVFSFDLGLAPAIDIRLTKDDQIPYYRIQATGDMIDEEIEHFKEQNGSRESVEDIEDNDLIKGSIVELDENGEPKANGIHYEEAAILLKFIKNEEEKAKFNNAKLHSTVVFNPDKAYDGDERELASFLNIKKEEAKNHTGDFSFEITEISRFKAAELNQDLYDKIFQPAGTVNSEEMFREKIKEELEKQLTPESDYKFILDARKLLEEKAAGMQLPDAFLKRWLLTSDSKQTPETIEKNFSIILSDLKFHLIREHLLEENNITVDDGEMEEYAKQATRAQFAQYGIQNIPDDLLEKYSREMLQKKETYRSLGDRIFENKLIKVLKEQATLEPQEISMEDFKKMIN